ncbi:MAG: glycoside hydrolase family 3 protein [Fusobacteriota bacterium]
MKTKIKGIILSILVTIFFAGCSSNGMLYKMFVGSKGNEGRKKIRQEKPEQLKEIDKKIDILLKEMNLDEKIGQMIQPERASLSPGEIKEYKIGSILSGGGSTPENNTPQGWLDMYNEFQREALETDLGIPILYGIDSVHGHNNLKGATIFPHNVGLGAMAQGSLEKGDTETSKKIVEKIGEITAKEMSATGMNFNFAPCVAVVQDIRWGRAYESFGEDPKLQEVLAGPYINGYQGNSYNIEEDRVIATAKHFVADGGTKIGTGQETGILDKGDSVISEEELRKIHLRGYEEAIENNVASVMASFSSWNGENMHAQKYLLTEVLKDELGFNGFVISDWEGVHWIEGKNYDERLIKSINAGVDMVMEPFKWRTTISVLKDAVKDDKIEMSRIDDAVRRILRAKYRAGLFENPFAKGKDINEIGSQEHREVAKEAVKKSLVLLKNDNEILPLSKNSKIYVDGSNADNIGNQCGGWTITWQGKGGEITEGITIAEGISQSLSQGKGRVVSKIYDADIAVVVIGEKPYTEGSGDDMDLEISNEDKGVLNRVKESGIPTLVIMVSGRPMIITDYIDDWDGFVQAWLPGTQGDGVSEVLFGEDNFYGRLPYTWPNSKEDIEDKSRYLYPYGYGLEM